MHLRTRKHHIDCGVVAQPVEHWTDRLGGYGFDPQSERSVAIASHASFPIASVCAQKDGQMDGQMDGRIKASHDISPVHSVHLADIMN